MARKKHVGKRYIAPAFDLKGKTFGSWTVLEFSDVSPSRKLYWLCECACGLKKPVEASSLRRGGSTRCGSCRTRAQRRKEKDAAAATS
jgi:hypothetical protein